MIGANIARIETYSTGKVVSVNAVKEGRSVDTTPLILSLYISYSGQIHNPTTLLPGGKDPLNGRMGWQ